MTLSIFDNKLKQPADNEIAIVLDKAKQLWDELKECLVKNYNNILEEWKYYGKTSGWTLSLKHQKRTILYLFPCEGFFIVLFVFGKKATVAAKQSSLPKNILNAIRRAKPYVEGRSFRVEVKSAEDLENVKKLAGIKMKH